MMQDTQVQLPPVPPEQPEPKKPSRVKLFVAAFGVGALLLAAGAALGSGGDATAVADPGSAPAAVTEACLDSDEAVSHSDAVASLLNQAVTATESYDVPGAASLIEEAASEVEAAAAATTADPAVSEPMFEAASLFRQAASELRSVSSMADTGPIYTATALMEQANSKIQESTTAVGLTTVPYC